MYRHRAAGQHHYVKAANKYIENAAKLKYLLTTVTSQNFIHGEIKSRENSANACYRAVQNVLSSRLLYKNVQTET
jgi:hypothetical protein